MKRQPRSSPHSAKTQRTVSIIGTGSYVPDKILTNEDLSRMVNTTDEWITTRTGIKERRIAAKDEHTSDMGAKAALKALEQAKISPKEIDLLLVATATPDMLFPATACFVQKKIGATKAACLDISAACAGFIFGIEIAQLRRRRGRGCFASSGQRPWCDQHTYRERWSVQRYFVHARRWFTLPDHAR